MTSALAGAAIGPAVAGLTLGIARQRGFNRQNGRNQAFNHAGNTVGAALSGLLGWRFGFPAVFALAAAFGLLSIASAMSIPREAIDDDAARGLAETPAGASQAKGWRVLLECLPLQALAAALCLFHLGNAAMLPLYGMFVVQQHKADPAAFVATTVVVAQAVMIGASLAAMWLAERRGYWLVMLLSFLALPIRGLLASRLGAPWGVFPIQALDGVGAGLQSVAVPGLVARVLDRTGRVNVGQGAVMTAQGLGAALSPALGGMLAQRLGYQVCFLSLGALALGPVALWLALAPRLRSAIAPADEPVPAEAEAPLLRATGSEGG